MSALLGYSGVASVVARVESAGHTATRGELVEACTTSNFKRER